MQLPRIRRAQSSLRAFTCLFAAWGFAALSQPAAAQPAAAPPQSASEACPPVDPEIAKGMERFNEMMLEPGKAMNMSELLRNMPPASPARNWAGVFPHAWNTEYAHRPLVMTRRPSGLSRTLSRIWRWMYQSSVTS